MTAVAEQRAAELSALGFAPARVADRGSLLGSASSSSERETQREKG